MALQQRIYDIDDLWDLLAEKEDDSKDYELIDGVLVETSLVGGRHGQIAVTLGSILLSFVQTADLGVVTAASGYYPTGNRYTLLGPDVAFITHARVPNPFPVGFVPAMPDLAVEIASFDDIYEDLQEKAEVYLTQGTKLVWIVLPDTESVEACRRTEEGELEREVLGPDNTLSGDDVLPGFALDVRLIFD